jgi:predicted enzyme related to lactoylglutathione lyase
MHARILNITFDCADARAQALFWAAVTGWTALECDATPGHVEYAVVPAGEGLPRLYFTTVPEPKQAKNRLHLDLIGSDDETKAELARLLSLGATVADGQPPGVGWLILADPEGNEFCLGGGGALLASGARPGQGTVAERAGDPQNTARDERRAASLSSPRDDTAGFGGRPLGRCWSLHQHGQACPQAAAAARAWPGLASRVARPCTAPVRHALRR